MNDTLKTTPDGIEPKEGMKDGVFFVQQEAGIPARWTVWESANPMCKAWGTYSNEGYADSDCWLKNEYSKDE